MTEIDIMTKITIDIGTLISGIKDNPVSIIEIVINSIKYNPTMWIVSIFMLIIAVITFMYGFWLRRKDYIICTIFLLILNFGLIILFYVSALTGHKIEFLSR